MEGVRALAAGIVGPGTIGCLHIQTLRAMGVSVTALVASSLESAQAHAGRLEVDRAYDSVSAMVESAEVDVVHVCTPNILHASVAAQAIEAGCALVCEKPLTFDLATAGELLASARRTGTKGGVCYHYRYFEGIVAMRDLVQSGALGSVRLLAGHYLSEELRGLPAGHWLVDPGIVGPSMSLADVGVHWLDLAEHVTGLGIRSVASAVPSAGDGEPFAHGAALLLALGEDTVGTVAVSQNCFGISPDDLVIEVYGSAGNARWSLGSDGERLCAWCEDGPNLPQRWYAKTLQEGTEQAFLKLMGDLYAGIRGERSSAPTFADGHHGVAILDAAVSSAAEGGWVEVPTA
jgi:predicted dehydrogenase